MLPKSFPWFLGISLHRKIHSFPPQPASTHPSTANLTLHYNSFLREASNNPAESQQSTQLLQRQLQPSTTTTNSDTPQYSQSHPKPNNSLLKHTQNNPNQPQQKSIKSSTTTSSSDLLQGSQSHPKPHTNLLRHTPNDSNQSQPTSANPI